jgi:hypothetical protein
MGDAFPFWHHSLFALIFYLQFPIAELAAIAELHLHSDAHFDDKDGATLIHEDERCLQRFLPQLFQPAAVMQPLRYYWPCLLWVRTLALGRCSSNPALAKIPRCRQPSLVLNSCPFHSASSLLLISFVSTPGAFFAERFKKKSKQSGPEGRLNVAQAKSERHASVK